ncbi:MAG: NAD(P)H-dependent oxidoreductase [Reinekea sp.]|jgi:FMN-dependent NADH-azoreductase
MKVFAVQTGIFGDHSNSNTLVNKIVSKLESKYEKVDVYSRDLSAKPLPYFDAQVAMALNTAAEDRNDAQQALADLSDTLIEEVKSADIIVLGVPMYNFGIPAQLKSWFDFIARAGATFKYTETGPVGLLADRPVYIAAARGGIHRDQTTDSQTAYLQTMLAFLGLQSVSIVYAEGLAMGDDAKAASLSQFEAEVEELA